MPKSTKCKSAAFEAIHRSASVQCKVGAINKATMRRFDESCLVVPPAIAPEQIKRLRTAARKPGRAP